MAKPDTREFRAPVVPSLSDWSVPRVRAALREHENGVFSASALLADALDRNPRINSALNTRVLGCMGLPFKFVAPDEGKASERERAMRWSKRHWRRMMPAPVEAQLRRWALLIGIAPAEIVYRYEAGEWLPRVKPWHPTFLFWNASDCRYYLLTMDGLVPFTPGDGRWLALAYSDLDAQPWMRGVVRCLSLADTVRNFAVRDWARWSEVHGLPIKVAKVPQNATPAEKDRFFDDVAGIGGESTVMAPFTKDGAAFDLELREATDNAHEGFSALIGRCDSDVCIALLGQSQSQGEAPGVYVPKTVGDGIRRDYQEADSVVSGGVFRDQLIVPALGFNLGAGAAECAPTPTYDASVPADLAQTATALKTLGDGLTALNEALAGDGLRVSARRLVERFDVAVEALPEPPEPDPAEGSNEPEPEADDPTPAPGGGAPKRGAAALARRVRAAPPTGAALVAGQAYVDDVADAALRAAPAALRDVLGLVTAAVAASTGYDDLRARLLDSLGGAVEPAALRALLTGAVSMAQGAGAWSVAREIAA